MSRDPKVIYLSARFQAHRDHVVAIFGLGNSTLGIRFNSPEQMLEFFNQLMEEAVKVWPDNEWIKEYLSD